MPELPEVEAAARTARRACVGRTIARVRLLHPAPRRALPARVAGALAGEVVRAIARRGKHQLFALGSGRTLAVHFRMTGDWHVARAGAPLPATARAVLDFTDGTALALVDPRALARLVVHAPGVDPVAGLGPEGDTTAFSAAWLARRVAGRRGSIKAALLDQRVVAGVGNIYAAEALWRARVDPHRAAGALDAVACRAVVQAVRQVLRAALAGSARYHGAASPDGVRPRFAVYDRAGAPCRRCATTIRREAQGGRGTYWCPGCQR